MTTRGRRLGPTARKSLQLVAACVAALAVAFALRGGVVAAQAQYGGEPTVVQVSAYGCIAFLGGRRTVPANSTIVIRQGWASTAIGGVQSFLRAEQTVVSVNDGPMWEASDQYGAPEPGSVGWVTWIEVPTGVTLHQPGDSMRFTFAMLAARPLTDPSDYDGDGKLDPPHPAAGLMFGGTCTVTAA